jgi:hypothetical protein
MSIHDVNPMMSIHDEVENEETALDYMVWKTENLAGFWK